MINSIFSVLSSSRSKFLKIFQVLSKGRVSPQDMELIEEMLIEADIGYAITNDIINIIQEGSDDSSDLKNNIKYYQC